MARRRHLSDSITRVATLAYVLILLWVLLGRPNARIRLMGVARKGLRHAARTADAAAERLGNEMIDRANITS